MHTTLATTRIAQCLCTTLSTILLLLLATQVGLAQQVAAFAPCPNQVYLPILENGEGQAMDGALAAQGQTAQGNVECIGELDGAVVDTNIVASSAEDGGAAEVLATLVAGLGPQGSQIFTEGKKGVAGTTQAGDKLGYAVATGDFNGDRYIDLAAGAPEDGNAQYPNKGAVVILYGSATGITTQGSQIFNQETDGVAGTPNENDRLGSSLAAGNFNGDSYIDLAVGVPGDGNAQFPNKGAVVILYGSAAGITAQGSQIFSQETDGVAGSPDADEKLGTSLAAGDFDGNSFDDLAVGAPGDGNATYDNKGTVVILYGSATGITAQGSQIFDQETDGVAGSPDADEALGSSLAAGYFNEDNYADLAAGAPGDGNTQFPDKGTVVILYGSATGITAQGSQIFDQEADGVAGTPDADEALGSSLAAGDFDGDTYIDLAVGAPGDGNATYDNKGTVVILYGSAAGITAQRSQIFDQEADGVAGTPDADEALGSSLAAGDFNKDGYEDLAAGAPRDGNSAYANKGAFIVLYGSATGITPQGSQIFDQEAKGVAGVPDDDEATSWALAAGDFNQDGFADLVAGAPYDDSSVAEDIGAVVIMYGFGPPVIAVSTSELNFVANAGRDNPPEQTFVLRDANGSNHMIWSAQTDASWLSVAALHPTAVPVSVTVTANISGLAPGTYTANILFHGENPEETSATMAVHLTLGDGSAPVLDIAPTQLQFTVDGGVLTPQVAEFAIRNQGGGVLNWSAVVTAGGEWLEVVSAGAGTATDGAAPVQLRPKNIAGLQRGVYTGQVTVTSDNGLGSPRIIPVVMQILSPPVLVVRSRQRIFNALYENGNPPPQIISIANGGEGALAWTASVTELSGSGWLHLDKSSGQAPDQIAVSVDIAKLSVGQVYQGRIDITAAGVEGSPKTIDVTVKYGTDLRLAVDQPDLSFFMVRSEGVPPAAQLLTIRQSAGTQRSFPWRAEAVSEGGWLVIDKREGDASADTSIQVSVNPGNLAVGRYAGVINLTGEIAQGLPRTIPIDFVVTDQEPAPKCQVTDLMLVDGAKAQLELVDIDARINTDGSCDFTASLLIDLPQNNRIRVGVTGKIDTQNRLDALVDENDDVTIKIASLQLNLTDIRLTNGKLTADATWDLTNLSSANPGAGEVQIDRKGLSFAGSQSFTFKPARTMTIAGFSVTIEGLKLSTERQADTFLVEMDGSIRVSVKNGPSIATDLIVKLNNRGLRQAKLDGFELSGVAGLDLRMSNVELTNEGLKATEASFGVPEPWGGLSVKLSVVKISSSGSISIGGGSFELPAIEAGDGFSLSSLRGKFATEDGDYIIEADGSFKLPMGSGKGSCTLEVGVKFRAGSNSSISMLEITPADENSVDKLVINRISMGLWDCPIQSAIPIANTGFYLTGVRGSVTLNSGIEQVRLEVQVRTAYEIAGRPVLLAEASATIDTRPPSLDFRAVVYAIGLKAADTRVYISKKDGFSATLVFEYGVFYANFQADAWSKGGQIYITGSGEAYAVLRAGTFGKFCVDVLIDEICASAPRHDWTSPVARSEFGRFTNGAFGIKGLVDYDFEIEGRRVLSFRGGFYVDHNGTLEFGNVDQYQLATRGQVLATKEIYAARARGEVVTASSPLDGEVSFAPNGDVLLMVEAPGPVFAADASHPLTVALQSDLIFMLAQPLTGTLTFELVDPLGREWSPTDLDPSMEYQQTMEDQQLQYTYNVPRATPGAWQARIGGDTVNTEYIVLTLGNVPPPILSNVTMTPDATPNRFNIGWQVQSTAAEVKVNVYANAGEATRTVTITQTDGTVTSNIVDVFAGLPLATGLSTALDGSVQQAQVDLSALPSGVYHLWMEADDSRNPPIRSQIASVTVDHSASFPAGAVSVATTMAGAMPASWETPLTALEDIGNGEVLLEWTPNPHPDIDAYWVRLRSINPFTPTIDMVEDYLVGDVESTLVSGIEPGVTYHIAVGAQDSTTGLIAWSQETALTTSQPDFSIGLGAGVMIASAHDALLTGAEDALAMVAGQQMTIPLQLNLPDNLPDPVVLSVDYALLSEGFDITFAEDVLVGSGVAQVGVTVVPGHEPGFYPVPIIAESGSLVRNLTLVIAVAEQGIVTPIYMPLIYR